ncbi:MAG: S46 family peptidase [Cytophagales bacterium]|nr:MAG: S46 family peptidase [Cytophagales bacterium]
MLFSLSNALADEGMWLPLLIKKMNYVDMQKAGLKLSAEEIYDINHASLKDAIVNFGNFCTGEVISNEGLLLTNHHCGYEAIQSQSSVQDNYLEQGFWAENKSKEKPTPGLTVTFLVRMEDVTQEILKNLPSNASEEARAKHIETVSKELEKKAIDGTHYTAEIKSFFEGNEFYLFVYETFKDIRWVGAPPSGIGKFGGDTDNWMWPRHTGDFSLFRIYSSPDGKPAEYNLNNVPYKPKHFLPISLKGIKKNDYTMIMGYPGNTERYLPSAGVKLTLNQSNPMKIDIRNLKLEIMKEHMNKSSEVKIKYAAKYAHISNYYKYFIGQNKGLKRLEVVAKKAEQEKQLAQWLEATNNNSYKNLIPQIEKTYANLSTVNPVGIYLEEALLGSEMVLLALKSNGVYAAIMDVKDIKNNVVIKATLDEYSKTCKEHFKNYDFATDKSISAATFKKYYTDIHKNFHPILFAEVEKKYKGDFEKYMNAVFEKSIFVDESRMNKFLENPSSKILDKDPGFKIMRSILGMYYGQLNGYLEPLNNNLDSLSRIYTKAFMEFNQKKNLYPNANFTMRLTYGSVQDYFPQDAVYYNYFTTLDGIIEKEDSTNEEFRVPSQLKKLYTTKDYGRYAVNGTVPVCFISTNDITGGNSGSPVINAEGHLIGTAFDGNWEAMSGDIAYEPALQRTISTDIRYVLFIIEKYAGAKHIINELKIIE